MRAVIQRVNQASVSGGGKVASIQQGLCVLLGIAAEDTEEDLEYIIQKTLHLKAFSGENEEERWKRSVVDLQGEILLVSQFTLHAAFKGQGRVSFHRSMPPDRSRELFHLAIDKFQENYRQNAVKACVFGSYMNVSLVNDGPVTFIIDSKSPKGL
ncbi:D-tyrosyl-tRNA(Tyr) deacylase [Galdieria sulphuraria]|nr:D-tyrosyl-tRNA(Tyr) deacylase [Galdieria sulphuraria]